MLSELTGLERYLSGGAPGTFSRERYSIKLNFLVLAHYILTVTLVGRLIIAFEMIRQHATLGTLVTGIVSWCYGPGSRG